MTEDKLNIDETTLSVDLSEATEAVKEARFEDALSLLSIVLKDHPDNVDVLYLAAVSNICIAEVESSRRKNINPV